jgi:hypothetical protein
MPHTIDQLGDVHLTLRPIASSVPVAIRLRRALKCLRRTFGLECIRAEEVPGDSDVAQDGPAGGQEASDPVRCLGDNVDLGQDG